MANSIAVIAGKGGANILGSVVPRFSRAVTCWPKQQFPVVNVIHVTSLPEVSLQVLLCRTNLSHSTLA
jgi:hypothetical protein